MLTPSILPLAVKVKRLHPDAIIPKLATEGAACFDLHAVCMPLQNWPGIPVDRDVYGPVTVGTGLSFDIPSGWCMLIFSRSGHGFKHGVRLANCVGVIDSDYRGEVRVRLTRDDGLAPMLRVKNGDRIAQAMLVPVQQVAFIETEELSDTQRGAGGFGSTGN